MPCQYPKRGRSEERDQDASTTQSSDSHASLDGNTSTEVMSTARKRVKQLKGDTAKIERSIDVIQNIFSREIEDLKQQIA